MFDMLAPPQGEGKSNWEGDKQGQRQTDIEKTQTGPLDGFDDDDYCADDDEYDDKYDGEYMAKGPQVPPPLPPHGCQSPPPPVVWLGWFVVGLRPPLPPPVCDGVLLV